MGSKVTYMKGQHPTSQICMLQEALDCTLRLSDFHQF